MLAELLHKIAEFEPEYSHPYKPRPSLAGPERCIRQLDYYAQGYDRKPFPGRAITVMEDSSWHEQLVLDWIRKSAFQVHSEQMLVQCASGNSYRIMGKIDGVITDVLGIDRLLEIKAISHFGFQEIWNGHLPLDYLAQSFLYLRGLNYIQPEIREGILLIKNKNQAQYLEIRFKWESEMDDAILLEMILSTGERQELNTLIQKATGSSIAKFDEVEVYRKDKKLHDRQYFRDHWRCEYCGWGETCWQNYEEEFRALSTSVELPEEFGDTCRYYLELGMQVKDMEAERDKIKSIIKGELKKLEAREATCAEYRITHELRSKKKIQEDLIPPQILRAATVQTTFEVMNIRKRGK